MNLYCTFVILIRYLKRYASNCSKNISGVIIKILEIFFITEKWWKLRSQLHNDTHTNIELTIHNHILQYRISVWYTKENLRSLKILETDLNPANLFSKGENDIISLQETKALTFSSRLQVLSLI
jgi:hypothetical protein